MEESHRPSPPPRVAYLESIRGLAAMQVLLLHCFSAFMPTMVFPPAAGTNAGTVIHLSPLFFLYDGYSAVYIFFVLSGFVLTHAFTRDLDRPWMLAAGRVVRLGIPALGATLAAAAIMTVFGRPNAEAGPMLGSAWFATLWHPELSLSSAVRDGLVNALLLGYRNMPGLDFLTPWQQDKIQSFAIPLWTLSIELYGSLLVLGLCLVRRQSRALWWVMAVLGAIFYFRSFYICFFAGHLIAILLRAKDAPARPTWPVLTVIAGVVCCLMAEANQPVWLNDFLGQPTLLLFPGPGDQMTFTEKALGATCIFIGILNWPEARGVLSRPWLVRLSRLSFPLYLIHWPILFGPAAAFFLLIEPHVAMPLARGLSIVVAIVLSLTASMVFARVDDIALTLSRRLRKLRTAPSPRRPETRIQPAE